MDAIRRNALVRGARVVAGAFAAGNAMSGNSGLSGLSTQGQIEKTPSFQSHNVKAKQQYNTRTDVPSPPDQIMEARYWATSPLHKQIEEIEGYSGYGYNLARFTHAANESTYLNALQSTAPWWRAHVAMEHRRRKNNAIADLKEQISKIISSPLNALEDTVQSAIRGFMNEIAKP